MSVNPHTFKKLSYNPDRDFAPIANLFFFVGAVMVSPAMPVSTIAELKDYQRTSKRELNFATLGPGTSIDIFRQWFAGAMGADLVGIGYKGGSEIIQSIAANETDVTWIGLGNRGGTDKIKVLAVDTPKRSPLFPDVPTFTEAGLPASPMPSWYGIAAPAGTPGAIVTRLNNEVRQLFTEPGFVDLLTKNFMEPAPSSPKAFADFMVKDRARLGELTKRFNVAKQ
jgi:tripartite-type tricarboxylate transporter receptor subunit TctC